MRPIAFYTGDSEKLISTETFRPAEVAAAIGQASEQFPLYTFTKHRISHWPEAASMYVLVGERKPGVKVIWRCEHYHTGHKPCEYLQDARFTAHCEKGYSKCYVVQDLSKCKHEIPTALELLELYVEDRIVILPEGQRIERGE